MVSLEWSTDRTDGVTLVTLRVENPASDRSRRVRVENRLDGPLWPPRRHGRPAAGWDENGFEGIVDAGDTLALGYATPAEPVDPPIELVTDEPVTDGSVGSTTAGSVHTDEGSDDGENVVESDGRVDEWTPAGVVRSLGDPIVPREAVPVPDMEGSRTEPGEGNRTDRSRGCVGNGYSGSTKSRNESVGDRDRSRRDTDSESRTRTAAGRDGALSARLAAVERRLAALEGR